MDISYRKTAGSTRVVRAYTLPMHELLDKFNKKDREKVKQGINLLNLQNGGSVTLSCVTIGCTVYTETLSRCNPIACKACGNVGYCECTEEEYPLVIDTMRDIAATAFSDWQAEGEEVTPEALALLAAFGFDAETLAAMEQPIETAPAPLKRITEVPYNIA